MARKKITKKPSKAVLRKAIHGSGGVMSNVAERIGCDWHTAKSWIYDDPALIEKFELESEIFIDRAESKLEKLLESEDEQVKLQTAKYILSTRGRSRGYGKNITVDNSNAQFEKLTQLSDRKLKEFEEMLKEKIKEIKT